MPIEENRDWSEVVDKCTLMRLEITVARVYEEKGTTMEHTKYIIYGIPVLNEEAMGDVIASELDEQFNKLAHEYTAKIVALQTRRIKHLDDVLKFGS